MDHRAWRTRAIVLTLALIGLPHSGVGQSSMTWPEATATLARGRTHAEICVGQLKKYGNDSPQIGRLESLYGRAKSHSDAAITGFITALVTKAAPASLPPLQRELDTSISVLAEFCDSVDNIVSAKIIGQRDILGQLIKSLNVPELLKAISDGITVLYRDFDPAGTLRQRTILTQLEAARWPDFGKIERAK